MSGLSVALGLTLCLASGLAGWRPARAADPAREELRFMRVHVPRDGLADVPLGDDRYVPMPRQDFEAALATTSGAPDKAAAPRMRRAETARYEARLTAAGRLEGRVAFDVAPQASPGAARPLPLGNLTVARCTARTDSGVGAAVVFGQADGTLAVALAGTGEYVADFTAPPPRTTADGPLHTLPLVPAVRSVIRLRLPAGQRPLPVAHDLPARRAGGEWLIETGPRPAIDLYVVEETRAPPAVFAWSRIGITGREVAVEVALRPASIWTSERVVFTKDPELVVTDAALAGTARIPVSWSVAADGRSVSCGLPPVALATRTPLEIRAVGPLPDGAASPLPTVRPPAERWSGGGTVIEVDPALALATIDFTRHLAVTAEAAAAWPLPAAASTPSGAAGVVSARVCLEEQGPGAEARVAVVPRSPRIDVARVTVVDFAPGIVVGTATCDVSVHRGEAFDLTGLIAPGWFIDTVDAVGWSPSPLALEPAAPEARTGEPLEWKVVRDARGDVLRIGLTAAATPGRRLRLRIGGHRAGAAAGESFTAGEIDMVRLTGEAEGLVAVGFKTSAAQAAEIVGATAGAIDPRLAALVDDPAVRAWTPVGERGPAWQVRLVRRRPPLDVHAQVRLTVRDDRLSQSFTFECRPDASDLDSLVVRFSEPQDERLEWSLLAPAGGTIAARRLESSADSWLVELTPPVREPVTIRAARTVAFLAPAPIPLAWVEGAPRQVGEVIVRDAGRRRPRIVNRGLAELPPRPSSASAWPAPVGEFSFAGADADGPAADLVPGHRDDRDARAWAWRETTTCWLHASGRTEYETVYGIENHGRQTVTISLPSGRHVQGVEIDGAPVAVVAAADAASIPVELPAGKPSFTLVVRGVAAATAWCAWFSDPGGVAIDLPVLDHVYRVAIPTELEIATVSSAWRSIGAGSNAAPSPLWGTAFRVREFVPAEGSAAGGTILVVRRRWLLFAAALVGVMVAVTGLAGSRGRPWLPPALCVMAGVAALWCPAPLGLVTRAAWWAALGATLVTSRWRGWAGAALAFAAFGSGAVSTAHAAGDLRVFITPLEEGEIALVPEALYRRLARGGDDDGRAVRVVACRVAVPEARPETGGEERWRMILDIDAAAAGALPLGPQEAADGWLVETARIDGQAATVMGVPGRHDLVVPVSGPHRVEIDLRPKRELPGDIVMLSASLPPAPAATLELEAETGREGPGPDGTWCEMAFPGGAFIAAPRGRPVAGARSVHDVSRAARVRLVRPHGPGTSLATAPPAVESRNTVLWDLDAVHVNAAFVVDPGRDVAAPCVVRADRGLARVGGVDPALDVVQLPGNLFLVRALRPTAGPLRFELEFRRPLADPVGIFPVPGAWIEGAATDARTTRLVPAGDLAVQLDAPAPLVMLAAADETGPANGMAWRLDVRPPAVAALDAQGRNAAAAAFAGEPRARVTVERRRQEIRGTQDVRVWFAPERTRITVDARLDASSTALVSLPLELPAGCVVDSIALFDDALQAPDPASRGPLETHWQRISPERGVLTVQRPLAGRFRLDVAAHVPRPPTPTGRVPLVRVMLPAAPVVVAWNESLPAATPGRSWQVRADDPPPPYALRPAADADPPAPAPVEVAARAATAAGDPRVELADVELTFQDRGRAWGRARFDVVTNARVVRLVLPRGMRLFDAFIDGQPTLPAVPAGDAPAEDAAGGERWEITLHDVRWPRSIEVVYAGAVGDARDDDGPIVVKAPTLIGLPCARCVWTLRAPRAGLVRVADPARSIGPAALRQQREQASAALTADFERAIAVAASPARDRLREALAARTHGLAIDRDAAPGPPFTGAVVHVVATPADAPLTVRIARQRDPGLAARAWATLALLVVGGGVWIMARIRTPV